MQSRLRTPLPAPYVASPRAYALASFSTSTGTDVKDATESFSGASNQPGRFGENLTIPSGLAAALTRERDPVWPTSFSQPPEDRSKTPAASPAAPVAPMNRPCFSLLDEPVEDHVARRRWTDSYLNLTLSRPSDYYEAVGAYFGIFDGRVVNWIGSQSIPTPLPAGVAGAYRSGLLPLLEAGHGGVKLSREELDKLACWIDLFVPYCGDYTEANLWTDEETEKFRRYRDKRKRMEDSERGNIEALMANRPPA